VATGRPPFPPVEPPACRWRLPDPRRADAAGVAGVGADLAPGTLLAAYRTGLFPMRVWRRGPIGWWSPDPRGVIPVDGVHESRSLRRSRRRFDVRFDTAFDAVVAGCADPSRPHGWIDRSFGDAYGALFEMGWAHSVEVWLDGELVGGLYGLGVGGLFAGESMFHRVTDASKVALVALVERLAEAPGERLFDVQWTTPHLASMGCVDVRRVEYLDRLAGALASPPVAF
jgi:leucyl/phenylalanyl-tRNA--protein transferase